MPGNWSLLRAALLTMALLGAVGSASARDSLDSLLKPYLDRYGLPALAAAVVKEGKVVAAGAVGTRRAGERIPVTVNDRFHLGSDTKAMTALLAATFVEAGKLRWESTLADVFPELAEKMDSGLRRVTLLQFLSHTSGVPSDNDVFGDLLDKAMLQGGNLDEMGYWLVKEWSRQPLVAEPGTKFAYANLNYIIVGSMIERAGGKTWDELITERLFTPLGLRSARSTRPSATAGSMASRKHSSAAPTATIRWSMGRPALSTCPSSTSRAGRGGTRVRASASYTRSSGRRSARERVGRFTSASNAHRPAYLRVHRRYKVSQLAYLRRGRRDRGDREAPRGSLHRQRSTRRSNHLANQPENLP